MIFTFSSYWTRFANSYLNIYPVIAVLLIIVYLFFKSKWKSEIVNWLYTFNTIVPLLSLAGLLLYGYELFAAWYGQNPYEWYAFSDNRINIFSPYGWSFWLMMAVNFLLPQLFWFRRLRKSIAFTFIIALVLSFGLWGERLVIYITSTYRDYLPSSWSTYYEGNSAIIQILLNLLCFSIVSLLAYWFLNKRKKLPFPASIVPYFLFFISYSLFHCSQNFN